MKQRIGDRYEFDRVTDVIGKGGMGTVYKGIDTLTSEPVAIKQLKPDIIEDNPDFVERFEREAEALRRLNHPNIVTVITTVADDDAHYLIMEYVGGGSLWDEMNSIKPLPIARVLQIALDLSDALTRAHRQKIIHRDLKPANVLIATDGTPRLTDFGVAQIQDKTRVTRTGAVVGTLNYLSPEALNGDPIDERTDIWAFGVLLYELLTGVSPFSDESTTSLITAILTKEPADVLTLRPDTPPRLARLISQMLIKDRNKRIDSIRKVGSELEDVIRNADSDDDLPTHIKQELMNNAAGRFDTPTPNETHVKPVTSKPMVTIVTSDTGEEYVMMPKKYANHLRWMLIIVPILAVAIGIFIFTRPRPDTAETNITIIRPNGEGGGLGNLRDNLRENIPTEIIREGDYPVAVFAGTNPNNENITTQASILEALRRTLETDIAYSNIRVVSGMEMMILGSQSETDQPAINPALIIRPEQKEDGLHVFLQLGDLSRFPYNAFERSVLERLINIELVVQSPTDIAPYVAGALAILHSADGDLFEFMRMMSVISQLAPSNATSLSAGVSASVYGYFANFINDQATALAFINSALERDGGNPLLFMYRGLVQLRQLNFENVERDITTANRIGPSGWILPMYAVSNFAAATERGTLVEQIIAQRPDDWFIYYLQADNLYTQNDLSGAREMLDISLSLDPQMNVAHLLSFVVAMREGRLNDAGRLLAESVRLFPDPNFSYRVLNATFGDLSVSILLYTSLANLIIGQYDTVIENTDIFLSFVDNPEAFIQDITQLSSTLTPNPRTNERLDNIMHDENGDMLPYLYAGDLFLMRGIAFCSLGNYQEAMNTYSIGLAIDPDNHMLRLLRSEIYFLTGNLEQSTADIALAMGLSDEMDAFISWATDSDGDNKGGSCRDFFDVFMAMAQE